MKRRAVKLRRRAIRRWTIYVLSEPETGEPRYIGVTHRPVERRYSSHLSHDDDSYRARWIRSLLKMGRKPAVAVLVEGRGEGWQEAEQYWIAYFRALGFRLTNTTDGGDGCLGYKHSKETRARMSVEKIGNQNGLGSPGFSGHKHLPESLAKMSATMRRKYRNGWKR